MSSPLSHRPRLKSSGKGKVERILGVDPGTMATGWGVVELMKGNLSYRAHGTILSSPHEAQQTRLDRIYTGLQEVVARYRPDGISIERVFFARNAQSALKLGQARGVALLAAAQNRLPVYEYTAAEIKLAAVGYGQASKEQMQKMVASLLRLSAEISDDAADALAAAICHIHRRPYQISVKTALSVATHERGG